MVKSVAGLYIEYEYITFVRVDEETNSVINMEIIPLDTELVLDKSILDGLKQLKKSGTLIKKEKIHVAYQSEENIFFNSQSNEYVEDLHEQLSWELMVRVDKDISKYSFASIPLDDNRGVGIATLVERDKKIVSLLKKIGITPASLGSNIVSLANVFDLNYDSRKDAVIFHLASKDSFLLYIKNGLPYDVVDMYGLTDSNAEELTSILENNFNLFATKWNISSNIPKKVSGHLYNVYAIKEALGKKFENIDVLNSFERVKNETGTPNEIVSEYNPIITVATGLALEGAE